MVAAEHGDAEEVGRSLGWLARAAPRDPWAAVAVGDYLARAGQGESSERAYRHALELAPDLSRAHLGLGLRLLARGDVREAEEHLAWAAGGEETKAWGPWVRSMVERGELEQAKVVWLRWFAKEVEPSAQLDRARLGLRVGAPVQAVDDLLALLNHPLWGADAVSLLWPAAGRAGRLEEAVGRLELLGACAWEDPYPAVCLAIRADLDAGI